MEKNKPQISIKVQDKPATFILIDEGRDPAEAKKAWLDKHKEVERKHLPVEQQRSEAMETIIVRTRKKQRGNTRYWNLVNNYPIKALLEHNASAIRDMNLLEKNTNLPLLLQNICEWGTTSPEEAIGTLEMVKEYFIQIKLN